MSALGVTGLVLAGGQARRMGGEDKGLVEVGGRAMARWVADALAAQCDSVLVSANRNADRYRALTGCAVVADSVTGYAGPLAGMLSGLEACSSELMVCAPCDSPLVAPGLVAGLRAALDAEGADLAVAHDGKRMQPVFVLLRTRLRDSMREFLDRGGRKIDAWYAGRATAIATFPADDAMFLNVNTPDDHDRLEQIMVERSAR